MFKELGLFVSQFRRSPHWWDGPTDLELIESTRSKFGELLKSRNEVRSPLKKSPEEPNIKRKQTLFNSFWFSYTSAWKRYLLMFIIKMYFYISLIEHIKMVIFEIKILREIYWFNRPAVWLSEIVAVNTLRSYYVPLLESELTCFTGFDCPSPVATNVRKDVSILMILAPTLQETPGLQSSYLSSQTS